MWVMTSWGILMPGLRPPGTVEPGDARTLQVRSRRERDLEILRDRYMRDSLGPIIQIPRTDYEYRAYCTPEAWGMALAQIGAEIDYVKFKDTTVTRFNDQPLHNLYVRMWGLIFRELSTAGHQDDYWSWQPPPKGKKAGKTKKRWWDDVEPEVTIGNTGLVDTTALGDPCDTDVSEALACDGLTVDGDVVRDSSGQIDHSFCDHGTGRNARRRCIRRNAK